MREFFSVLSEFLDFSVSLLLAIIILALSLAGLCFVIPDGYADLIAFLFILVTAVTLLGIHFWQPYNKKSEVTKQAERWFEEQRRLDQIRFQQWENEFHQRKKRAR